MTGEQELLLALLRGELTGTAAELDEKTLPGGRLGRGIKGITAQAVTLMAADALSPFGKYVTNIGAWTSCAARLMRANFALLQSEVWLENAIAPEPMVILKGMSAASYYCKPSGRVLGDIDFLTDPAKTDALLDCLTEKGCKIIDEPGDSSHHRELTHGSTLLELHFAIPGIPFGKAGELVCARAEGMLSRRVVRELDGQKFPSPAPTDHALVLLLHTQNHMQEAGVGLRHLCDWAAFLRAEADGAFWPEFLDFLKEIGLLRFAEVLSKTCAMYLGAPLFGLCEGRAGGAGHGNSGRYSLGRKLRAAGRDAQRKRGFSAVIPGRGEAADADTEALAEPAWRRALTPPDREKSPGPDPVFRALAGDTIYSKSGARKAAAAGGYEPGRAGPGGTFPRAAAV